jgi:hypothetical protein
MKVRFERRELTVLIAAACGCLLFVALYVSAQNNEKAVIQDSEEYAVYSALLNTEYASANVKRFVITRETDSRTTHPFRGFIGGWAPSGAKRPETEPATKSDFDGKNDKSCLLDRRFADLKTQYDLVTSDELHGIFVLDADGHVNEESWAPFYKRYPGAAGILTFSRVGFNSKKHQALVYVAIQRGLLGGSARFFVLAKINKTWEVRKQVVVGLS